jgi:hypothetical protein
MVYSRRYNRWYIVLMANKYLSINVKNNIKEFSKKLNGFQKKQIPFVAATTLTDVAFHVRKNAIDKSFPQAFKNSTTASRMAKGRLRVLKAQKRDYNIGRLSSKVLDKSSNPLEYLVTHQTGGMKRAKSGNFIAVPSSKIKKKLGTRRNPQWRPTAVRDMTGVRTVKSGKFVRGKSEQAIIKGSERYYSLVKTVPIPKRLFFEENAEKTVQKKIQYIWNDKLSRALSTARFK